MNFADPPYDVDAIKEKGLSTQVSWSHSLPRESQFHNDLEYRVVEFGRSRKETVLEGRQKPGNRMIIKGCHKHGLKVRVAFNDNPELGYADSDLYKGMSTVCD